MNVLSDNAGAKAARRAICHLAIEDQLNSLRAPKIEVLTDCVLEEQPAVGPPPRKLLLPLLTWGLGAFRNTSRTRELQSPYARAFGSLTRPWARSATPLTWQVRALQVRRSDCDRAMSFGAAGIKFCAGNLLGAIVVGCKTFHSIEARDGATNATLLAVENLEIDVIGREIGLAWFAGRNERHSR